MLKKPRYMRVRKKTKVAHIAMFSGRNPSCWCGIWLSRSPDLEDTRKLTPGAKVCKTCLQAIQGHVKSYEQAITSAKKKIAQLQTLISKIESDLTEGKK